MSYVEETKELIEQIEQLAMECDDKQAEINMLRHILKENKISIPDTDYPDHIFKYSKD